MIYILVCTDCDPDSGIPFRTARERALWADAHMMAEGHIHWTFADELADW